MDGALQLATAENENKLVAENNKQARLQTAINPQRSRRGQKSLPKAKSQRRAKGCQKAKSSEGKARQGNALHGKAKSVTRK